MVISRKFKSCNNCGVSAEYLFKDRITYAEKKPQNAFPAQVALGRSTWGFCTDSRCGNQSGHKPQRAAAGKVVEGDRGAEGMPQHTHCAGHLDFLMAYI